MRNIYFLMVFFPMLLCGQGQNKDFKFNNLTVRLNTVLPLFQDFGNNRGMALLDTDTVNFIFSSSFITASKLANDELRISAMIYYPVPLNYGPKSAVQDEKFSERYNRFFEIDIDQINYHKNNFFRSDYVMPEVIRTWPGNGNINNKEPQQLAPYTDADNNGVYNPLGGDFPNIKGDKAVLFIQNDLRSGTNINPLTLDYIVMVYAFKSDEMPWRNTIYASYTVINRSQDSYAPFYAGMWNDFDVGCLFDDYLGSMVDQEAVLCYNNGPVDKSPCQHIQPYAAGTPPAVGMTTLSHQMEFSMGTGSSARPFPKYPTKPEEVFNFFNGYWSDGCKMMYGGNGHRSTFDNMFPEGIVDSTQYARYYMPGDSDPEGRGTGGIYNYGYEKLWVDSNVNNPEADRAIMSSSSVPSFDPGERLEFEYAWVVSHNLRQDLIKIRNRNVGIGDPENITGLHVYPNPASTILHLDLPVSQNVDMVIVNSTGAIVYRGKAENQVDIQKLTPGVYLINVITDSGNYSARFIKIHN